MKRGISILLFAILFFGCMKHESLLDEGKGREEAEKNFPVKNIHPDQNWVMATARTLNVTVNEKTGKTYVIKVFNDNPFNTESDVRLLAQKEVKDGQSATIRFDAPTILERVYVMRQAGEDYVVRLSDMKNELFSVTFGEIESRSVRAGSAVPTVNISKYATFDGNAKRVTDEETLKKLHKGAWYIDSEIECKGDMSLGPETYLYIKNEGRLIVSKDLKIQGTDSFISVLEGGTLIIKEDFILNGDEGKNGSTAFYNAGTVMIINDIELKKGLWINAGSFVSNDFKVEQEGIAYNMATAQVDDAEVDKGLWINEGTFTANEFEVDERAEVWNRCRLIITGEDDDNKKDKKDDEVFSLSKSVFNNEGYVHVIEGNAEWEESVINLIGDAVFNIAGKLEIDEDAEIWAEGKKTLILAGKVELDGDVYVSGTINICPGEPLDDDEFPDGINITSNTITDTGECTVYTAVNPVPNIPLAVTTYGFEDTVDGTTDYDFNDVVLQVSTPVDNKITVTLVAAGATNPIRVQYSLDAGETYKDLSFNGESEVHAAFCKAVTEMINTSRPIKNPDSSFPSGKIENVPESFSFIDNGRIRILVNGETTIDSYTTKQGIPYALSVPIAWEYPTERVRIDQVYTGFGPWGENMTNKDWYMPQSK